MASEYEKPPPYSPYPPTPGQPTNMTHPNPVPPGNPNPVPPYQYPVQQQPQPHGFQAHYPPQNYGTVTVTMQPQEVIIIGTCPACRVGIVEDDYTCLGIFCAIFFFPLGIIACLLLKNRRCSNCGAYFA